MSANSAVTDQAFPQDRGLAGKIVRAALRFAAAQGLRIAAQGTGHLAGPLGDLAGAILLKTERMRGLWIDPAARIARAEAGVVWLEVVEAAARHRLAGLAGSSPDVGVVGYTLGGGLSFLGLKYGLAVQVSGATAAVPLLSAEETAHRPPPQPPPRPTAQPAPQTKRAA